MNIAIAGASDIGFHLAKLLSFEAQDITLIDADKELLNYADNNLDLRAVKETLLHWPHSNLLVLTKQT